METIRHDILDQEQLVQTLQDVRFAYLKDNITLVANNFALENEKDENKRKSIKERIASFEDNIRLLEVQYDTINSYITK